MQYNFVQDLVPGVAESIFGLHDLFGNVLARDKNLVLGIVSIVVDVIFVRFFNLSASALYLFIYLCVFTFQFLGLTSFLKFDFFLLARIRYAESASLDNPSDLFPQLRIRTTHRADDNLLRCALL
jgi:hypothetical protein